MINPPKNTCGQCIYCGFKHCYAEPPTLLSADGYVMERRPEVAPDTRACRFFKKAASKAASTPDLE